MAEKRGPRRVLSSCPQGSFSAKRSPAGGGRKVWKESDAGSLARSATSPVGRVALVMPPPPMIHRSYSFTLLPTLFTRSIRVVVEAAPRTGGRPRGACGEGGTTVGADLLSGGLAPPFCLVTGPSFQLLCR